METQGLTTKEAGFIEECIKAEVLCATKARAYEQEVRDPELRDFCRQAVQASHRHIDQLMGLLH